MAGYIGKQPLSEAIQSRVTYTATSGQTTFSFSYQPGFLDVYVNGVKQINTTDFAATNGTDVVLTVGATTGWTVALVAFSTMSLINGKINYNATAAPTTGDDNADGYRVGSTWIDTTNDEVYRCVDDTNGAAVWVGSTLETTDLGALALLDSIPASKLDSNSVTNVKMADDAVGIDELSATGTASSSTFLRGDNAWTAVDTTNTLTHSAITTVTSGSTTTYSFTYSTSFVMVFINRTLLRPSEFTATNGTSITFSVTLNVGDEIEVLTA